MEARSTPPWAAPVAGLLCRNDGTCDPTPCTSLMPVRRRRSFGILRAKPYLSRRKEGAVSFNHSNEARMTCAAHPSITLIRTSQ